MNTAVTTVLGRALTVNTAYGQTHYRGSAEAGRKQKATVALAKKLAAAITGEKLVWKRRGFGSPSAKLANGKLVYAAATHQGIIDRAPGFDYHTEEGWMPEVSVEVAA